MLPHERSLVKRLEDKPFALLGINSDGDAATVKKRLEESAITWRNAIDGTPGGPLATKWNVNGWPAIYILDVDGKIRYRDLRDEEMEKAIMVLLAEAEAR